MLSDAEIRAEAMRVARDMVKEAIRKAGVKMSSFDAKDITLASKALLLDNPQILEYAKARLAFAEFLKGWGMWSKLAAAGEWR
jgi:hypothetical protein